MNIKINSFNSVAYPSSVFIDCKISDIQELMKRAVNIDVILQLDNFSVNFKRDGQTTSFLIPVAPDIDPLKVRALSFYVTPRRAIIGTQLGGFFAPRKITFRSIA